MVIVSYAATNLPCVVLDILSGLARAMAVSWVLWVALRMPTLPSLSET